MRFALFAGSIYYPNGGAADFKGFFPSINEAKKYLSDHEYLGEWGCWWQIVNPAKMEIIEQEEYILR